MSPESWQTICPRCGWANSGAERKCLKCGQALRTSPGLLVAGQTAGSAIAPQATPPKRVVQPGGFFPRLIALIVDVLILGVVVVPVIYLWVGQPKASGGAQGNFATDLIRNMIGGAVGRYSNDQLTQLIGLVGGLFILSLFYFAGTWSILGGSPGQLLMSLRVVDRDARTMVFGHAMARFLVKGLFFILAPVSALMVAFGKDKRAIHDAFAGTYVIQFLDPTAEDLPTAQPVVPEEALPPAMPAAPPAPAPEPAYAAAAVPAAAVSPEAPLPPPQVAAEPPPAAPPPPPPTTDAEASVFESYSAPSAAPTPAQPEPSPPEISQPGATPPEPAQPVTGPPPAAAAQVGPENPPESAPAGLPVFPTAQPGELQPMAPRPAEPLSQTAPPPAPAEDQPPPAEPYALPFMPAPPPPDPPTPPPPPAPEE
ncbi:MAG TPA: RDD family protein [Candidatus Solibacter sp.]|jgi:uncharacterized RDD family membrane protein YckC|nr:RDD family protein [Candidatus Solibacter sp.]